MMKRFLHSSPAPRRIYNSILETIGNTPVIKINNIKVGR
jgi:hypothetical protein